MKIKCCRNCVVDPMCKIGCDKLWKTYEEANEKRKQYQKIGRICFWTMISLSMINFLSWQFEIVIPLPEDRNYRVIPAINLTYWYWWYMILYCIPLTYSVFILLRQRVLRKLRVEIHCGERSSFINEMLFKEALVDGEDK